MEYKGVKGDWKTLGNKLQNDNRIIETNNRTICHLLGADFVSDNEMDNTSKLITSALDLLEALQSIVNQIENEHVSEFMDEFTEKAKKAIDKALK